MNRLILVPTRQCNLRCSYCPTVKDGWPELTSADALRAIDGFLTSYGRGEVKLFGGEPLLAPAVVDTVIRRAETDDAITGVTLCTNGIALDERWTERIASSKKVVVALSLDGTPEDNRRFRRQLVPDDAYDRIVSLSARLSVLSNVVITQVIPPASAARGALNFRHLVDLGFRRFKLLPAYYVPWSAEQLGALRGSFEDIAATVRSLWRSGSHVYIRNLFSLAANPTFNSALTVDADRRVYASDFVLTAIPDDRRASLCIGTLDEFPDPETLSSAVQRLERSLASFYDERIWDSTSKADAELTRFCRTLYPAWKEWRARRFRASSTAAQFSSRMPG